jgi:hypothetical protein
MYKTTKKGNSTTARTRSLLQCVKLATTSTYSNKSYSPMLSKGLERRIKEMSGDAGMVGSKFPYDVQRKRDRYMNHWDLIGGSS